MRIFILMLIFCVYAFASASKSMDNMNANINELNQLYTLQNKRHNESLALDKDKALSLASLIFLLTKHNELLMNYFKIKGQK